MSDTRSFGQRIKKLSKLISTKIKKHPGFDTETTTVVTRRHSSYIQPIPLSQPTVLKEGKVFFFL